MNLKAGIAAEKRNAANSLGDVGGSAQLRVKRVVEIPPRQGKLAQTNRMADVDDYPKPGKLLSGWGAGFVEERLRAWLAYEFARESQSLRRWAGDLVVESKQARPPARSFDQHQLGWQLAEAFNSLRDAWLTTYLRLSAPDLAKDLPWTKIDEKERYGRIKEAQDFFEAGQIVQGGYGQARQRHVGVRLARKWEIRESMYSEDDRQKAGYCEQRKRRKHEKAAPCEVFPVVIPWDGTRNDELLAAFGDLLVHLRPPEFPERPAKGRAGKNSSSAPTITVLMVTLEALGVTRAAHAFPARDAFDHTAKDDNARARARKTAKRVFREFFPFLANSGEEMRAGTLFRDRKD